ncbi:MAG: endonuclease III [Candidatus Cloacimonadota bacterium]|nr:MAG: endonuclease III [Candidatus Cloacimonadota bacterium]
MIDNNNIDKVLCILRYYYHKNKKPIVTQISEREKNPYKILISTVLSLRTKDRTTSEASKRLFAKADTLKKMVQLSIPEIEQLIYPVGFYHRKARNIAEISNIILEKYNGQIPDKLDELLKLPGVGRKTANLVITLGYNKLGICVDTHVHRISNRWGYVKTKSPEQTEFALRKNLPEKWWIEYNDLLVSFGQNNCVPISPFCSTCKIIKYCPQIGVTKHR